MHETIVRLPHSIAGIPVFGFGLALALLLAAAAIRIAFLFRVGAKGEAADAVPGGRRSTIGDFLANEAWAWGIGGLAIAFVLPKIELQNIAGDPVGVAIRGYGVFLLCGVGSAIALAAYRAKARGIDPDAVIRMAPWAFFGGIIGARLFYVIQYRDRFVSDSLLGTLGSMLRFTEGGLVVYGSFIGGGIGVLIFMYRNRLPILRLGDVIVPCLFLGVFFGRMGCLMHGCCWGGRCEASVTSLQFPPGSPVYMDQMFDGSLIGLDVDPVSRRIESVAQDSVAERNGIVPGEIVRDIRSVVIDDASVRLDIPEEEVRRTMVLQTNRGRHRLTPDELPARALPVQPAQLISSLGGLLLCISLCLIRPGAIADGSVMWLGFAGYAVLRFVLEWIRVDEAGQFGTSLSISQWVSVLVLVMSVIGFAAQRFLQSNSKADAVA